MRSTAADGRRHLDELGAAARSSLPLDGLAPAAYARGHALFEARSDQREGIASWLVDRLASRTASPLSVLAVGCGDGALDASVAGRVLAGGPHELRLRYVGVDPFATSARRFSERMERIDSDQLSFDTVVAPFEAATLDEPFDVVTFVHSLYYVPDVGAAARAARSMLRPGGEAVILSAPRGALNLLAGLLAPAIEGHRQWFGDDVHEALVASGLDVVVPPPIEAVVDLTDASDEVLDFTVQARLTPELRGPVRRYLGAVSLVEGRSELAHPVDVYIVRAG